MTEDIIKLSDRLEVPPSWTFHSSGEVRERLRAACAGRSDVARYVVLGKSEAGRSIDGIILGHGSQHVTLIAGNHADEPVGPETLRFLVLEVLRRPESFGALFDRFSLFVVPHTNPDGEARNQAWISGWPDLPAYLRHVQRELPGRDVEFGFPDLRMENEVVGRFLREACPVTAHLSLHGMAFAEGGMLLIERRWTYRTEALQEGFIQAAHEAGLGLHDHNRKGEKGFFYVGPGFWTTPEGAAMRAYFRAAGDYEMAGRFKDSSMEFVRRFSVDPLCVVTELPLFVLPSAGSRPGHPAAYLAFREALPAIQQRLGRGEDVTQAIAEHSIRHVPLHVAMNLHVRSIELALATIA